MGSHQPSKQHAWLTELGLVDSPCERAFDHLVELVASMLQAPVALLSIVEVDQDRQYFKSEVGLPQPWKQQRETPLTHSFCQHVVRRNEPLRINDAANDPLVSRNLAVSDLKVAAYLGTPVYAGGQPVGALCVIENQPRNWLDQDLVHLVKFAGIVTDEIELRAALRESGRLREQVDFANARYRNIVETQEELICRFDRDFRLTFVNGAYARYFGRDDLVGSSFLELIPAEHHDKIIKSFKALPAGGSQTIEHQVVLPDGNRGWQLWTDQALASECGDILEYQSVGRDITKRKRMEEQVRQLATHDYLTGLPNRFAFEQEMERSVARARRQSSSIALILVDVDRFKQVNDHHGHKAGDDHLIHVARQLRHAVRRSDFVARLGGDEFAIIVEDIEEPRSLDALFARLFAALAEDDPALASCQDARLSAGCSMFPDDSDSIDVVRQYADAALYAVKSDGGNGWRRYRTGMCRGLRPSLDFLAQTHAAQSKGNSLARGSLPSH